MARDSTPVDQDNITNPYELACKEVLKGCGCTINGDVWECEECMKGFFNHIKFIVDIEEVIDCR